MTIAAVLTASQASASTYATASNVQWTLNGQSMDLYQMRGHFVVLNFFATWCPACRWEQQAMLSAAHDYASKDVTFVGIDVGGESVDTVTQFAQRNGVDYPLVVDTQSILDGEYHITALPTTVVVNPDGEIVKRVEGGLAYQDVTAMLDALMAAN